mmetsp:Transcript_45337/g.97202  ORF Transcript_45337/g.97202 Transcript_45337/m.97202 type:complete len:378 (+) Transcript_45337:106-1239(+)
MADAPTPLLGGDTQGATVNATTATGPSLPGAAQSSDCSNHDCLFDLIEVGPRTGIVPLGIGTNSWGTNVRKFDVPGLKDAFTRSLEMGITLFDTAQIYNSGESESMLGIVNAETGKKAVIMSKFNALGKAAKDLVPSLRETLSRCKVDRLDVFFIHHPKGDPEVLARELGKAVQEGLISAVGVSNYGEQALRAFHALLARHGVPLKFNEIEFSLLRRSPERGGLLRTCEELGVKVVAWAPLAQGRLTGKHTQKIANPGTLELLKVLERIAQKRGKTQGQVAINWCCCKGTIPIPGARSRTQLEQNAGGVLGWRLTPEEVAELDSVAVDEGGLYRDPEAAFATWGWPAPLFRCFVRGLFRCLFSCARRVLPLQERCLP